MFLNQEGFEIDFHNVGNGTKSGDAISIRYGNLKSLDPNQQKVIVIDGGTKESGDKLVSHIQTFYKTDIVDLVINTHPDNDHCSGLRSVMENLKVKQLWLHQPWHSCNQMLNLFKDGRITSNSLKDKLIDGLNIAYELEEIAKNKNVIIEEPYVGLKFDNGVINVLGPTKEFYFEQVSGFRSTPQSKLESFVSKGIGGINEAINYIYESMDKETLDETGDTSSENNSSVVTLFTHSDKKCLFTSDAGIEALKNVIESSSKSGIDLNDLHLLQVPHHGSKRNITPSLIDALRTKTAYVSCSPGGLPKHPSRRVTNAFLRRNVKVFSTNGVNLMTNYNGIQREGWSDAPVIEFHEKFED